MLRPENGPRYKLVTKTFAQGANTDIEKEFLPDGIYHDAENMRPASVDGHAGSINKIGGEALLYSPSIDQGQTYVCIGACTVAGRRVIFWASPEPEAYPLIQINGEVMARSPLIPYRYDRPLQFGDVSNCMGGVIYPADDFSRPMFWDIPKIEAAFAAGTDEYFENFSPESNSVSKPFSASPPRFRSLLSLGTGCPAGQYGIAIRGRNEAGDLTNMSLPTPLVSVPLIWDQAINNAYPGGRTTGGATDPQNPTPFHIQFEYRIDNLANYTEIEIILRRYNDGQGLNGPGITEIVGRFPIQPGLNPITSFIYPLDSNVLEVVPPDEAVVQQMNIIAPKAVEYVNNRVVYGNFEMESRLADLTFRTLDGSEFFWATKRLTTDTPTGEVNTGYTDPYHATYNKSAARGGRYGIGIMPVDGSSGFAPVVPMVKDTQAPNRRDPKTGRGLSYSTDGLPAATTQNQSSEPVNNTYEAFSQGIFQKNNAPQAPGYTNVMTDYGFYYPWRPTSPTDPEDGDYNYKPIDGRVISGSTVVSDTGSIWAPQYHSLGFGINAVENIPDWCKAFAVMRTAEAGRVVMQGIGSYRIEPNDTDSSLPIRKSLNELWFYAKDAFTGLVPQTTLDDIRDNPQNYKIQVVSPLGFYTEPYGYWATTSVPSIANWAGATDMLTYAGVQHDEGQVNVGEPGAGGMGVQPGPTAPVPPGNYVGYQLWRAAASGPYNPWAQPGADGNTLLPIDAFIPVSDGRQSFYRLRTTESFYSYYSINDSTNFQSTDTRNWHEPFYIINIVREGAEVPDLNSQQYHYTGEVVLMESAIAVTTSDAAQSYRLLNERLEDVRGQFTTEYRYIYVRSAGLPERAWVCSSNNASLPTSTVLADIAANGFWVAPDGTRVYGIYEALTAPFGGTLEPGQDYVVFGGFGQPIPPSGSRVVVKYNPDAPVIAYGFDRTISSCTYAPIDKVAQANTGATNTSVQWGGTPMPYTGWSKAPGFILPDTGTTPQATSLILKNATVRQWVVMFDTESLTPGAMDLFSTIPNQSFPRIHYVLRPYRDINYSSGVANGFWPQYDIDYPNEAATFNYGGLRFLGEYNLDYAKQDKVLGVSVPDDFEERLDYCTGLIASAALDPLQQNSPGNLTFGFDNLFIASEENGEIKTLNSLNVGGLQSIYGHTERGVFKLPYNQTQLVGSDGNLIGTQATDQFWGSREIWLSRGQKGMPGQFWRLSVKAHAPTGSGDADSVFWADRVSVYRLTGDSIIDIARNKYLAILSEPLRSNGDYVDPMSSMYNQKHDEYWLSMRQDPTGVGSSVVFVFNARNNQWTGRFTYNFDQYLCDQTTLLGMRGIQTFELDKGSIIDGKEVSAWAETPYAPFPAMQTELVTFRVSPMKPTRIEVYDHDHNLIFFTDENTNGPLWVKYIDSWEQQMGRRNLSLDPEQKRVQDFLFYKRVIHGAAVPFRMTFSQLNTKQIP